MSNRCTLMNYDAAIVLEILNEWSSLVARKFSNTSSYNRTQLTITPSGFKYPHTLLDSSPRKSVVVWGVNCGQYRDIYTKRLGSQLPGFSDGFP